MNRLILLFFITFFSCSTRDKYDPARYVNAAEKDELVTSIVTYIYTAPPYVSKADRFKRDHRFFYSDLTPRFPLQKLYVADDGTYYYFLLRPGPVGDKEIRGAGGHFRIANGSSLKDFREIFVTPLMTKEQAIEKGSFLFDKMVQGDIEKYLKMQTYVQWPNEISEYDTTTYEWKLKEGAVK